MQVLPCSYFLLSSRNQKCLKTVLVLWKRRGELGILSCIVPARKIFVYYAYNVRIIFVDSKELFHLVILSIVSTFYFTILIIYFSSKFQPFKKNIYWCRSTSLFFLHKFGPYSFCLSAWTWRILWRWSFPSSSQP